MQSRERRRPCLLGVDSREVVNRRTQTSEQRRLAGQGVKGTFKDVSENILANGCNILGLLKL